MISSSHSIVIDGKSNEHFSVKKRDVTGEDTSEAEDTLSTLSLNGRLLLLGCARSPLLFTVCSLSPCWLFSQPDTDMS